MVITKEALEARIAELEKQREQKVADLNAIGGAIQDCQWWLAQLAEENDAGAAR